MQYHSKRLFFLSMVSFPCYKYSHKRVFTTIFGDISCIICRFVFFLLEVHVGKGAENMLAPVNHCKIVGPMDSITSVQYWPDVFFLLILAVGRVDLKVAENVLAL